MPGNQALRNQMFAGKSHLSPRRGPTPGSGLWRHHLPFAATILLLACAAHNASGPTQLVGTVGKVIDGDTISVDAHGEAFRIRLAEIDCPEAAQRFATEAKEYASQLALGRKVTVLYTRRDVYGRILGKVTLPGGRSLNHEMISAGYAWHYKRDSKDTELARLEQSARGERRGLWQDHDPEAPWEYRKRLRDSDN